MRTFKSKILFMFCLVLGIYSGISHAGLSKPAQLIPNEVITGAGYGNNIDLSGNRVIIGASCDSTFAYCSGAAYIFEYVTATDSFELMGKLLPLGADVFDFAAVEVAIDGDHAFISAYSDDEFGYQTGAIYAFQFDGTAWNQIQIIKSEQPIPFAHFGERVDIDGDLAVVGAWLEDNNGIFQSGAAYILQFDGVKWNQIEQITSPNAGVDGFFGTGVAIENNQVLIGASGANRIYHYEIQGQQSVFKGELAREGVLQGDFFGFEIQISQARAVISSHRDDTMGNNAGAAYVYELKEGNWVLKQKLLPSRSGGSFARKKSLNEDCLIIRQKIIGTSDSGQIYMFQYDGVEFVETAFLQTPGNNQVNQFGSGTACLGEKILIGDEAASFSGSSSGGVYVFDNTD